MWLQHRRMRFSWSIGSHAVAAVLRSRIIGIWALLPWRIPLHRPPPVVAASGGFAEFKRSNAGGSAVWLTTSEGDRFYYAHLDAWEGATSSTVVGRLIPPALGASAVRTLPD